MDAKTFTLFGYKSKWMGKHVEKSFVSPINASSLPSNSLLFVPHLLLASHPSKNDVKYQIFWYDLLY